MHRTKVIGGKASSISGNIAPSFSMRRFAIAAAVYYSIALSFAATASDWPQWRGPSRDGISKEAGLLKEWPQEGPKLLWSISDIGTGYSTPAVVGESLYLQANEGLENEFVKAVSVKNGAVIWSVRIGNVGNPKQQPNFPAARSTPTVDGKYLYALGSDGDLACVDIANGKIRWQKNLRKDFGGKPGTWAYAESPLVDGDRVICTPGGGEATMVALDKTTGDLLWKTALPEADEAAYASALAVDAGGVKQYVQLLQKGLVGLDAKTGKLLWRYAKPVSAYNANIPTPVASGDYIYAGSAGTGGGTIKLKSKDGGIDVEPLFFGPKYSTAIGGVVKVGDCLFGTTAQTMQCIEFATGLLKWDDRGQGAASLCYADGRLYLHGENGEVSLVDPSPEAFREKGRFNPPGQPKHSNPMEKAWAYPVVANGRLFIRDHGTVWCYDVAER